MGGFIDQAEPRHAHGNHQARTVVDHENGWFRGRFPFADRGPHDEHMAVTCRKSWTGHRSLVKRLPPGEIGR